MEQVKVRCKVCNRELLGREGKTVSCGCSNMTTIRDNNNITAVDLSNAVLLNSFKSNQKNGVLSQDDIAWQEARRQRKVRRLDFEIR
jgi:hypothetical protein